MLTLSELTKTDLTRVINLQPEGWGNIIPNIEFYLESSFCFPIKAEINNKLIGIGASIAHRNTAWLAHIIVHPENRNKGIAKIITQALIHRLAKKDYHTLLLVATKMGEPVYRKLGFEQETEYIFFKDGTASSSLTPLQEIIPFNKKYEKSTLQLDCAISGENRTNLLKDHLANSWLVVEQDVVTGCFLPTLGEGLVLAEKAEAGLALLNKKHLKETKTVLPMDNVKAIEFLLQNGFHEYSRGTRMRLGRKLKWSPDKIYNRIGGNLG